MAQRTPIPMSSTSAPLWRPDNCMGHSAGVGTQVVVGGPAAPQSSAQESGLGGAHNMDSMRAPMQPLEQSTCAAKRKQAEIMLQQQQQHQNHHQQHHQPPISPFQEQVHQPAKRALLEDQHTRAAGQRQHSMSHHETQPPPFTGHQNMPPPASGAIKTNQSRINNNNQHGHQDQPKRTDSPSKRSHSTKQKSFKQELVKRYCAQMAEITSQPKPSSSALSTSSQVSQLKAGPSISRAAPKLVEGPPPQPGPSHINTSPYRTPTIHLRVSQDQSNSPIHIIRNPLNLSSNQLHYVTLEDFRCSCFMMAGEPYLCMPPLLKFLHKRFSLLRIVKTIDDFNINFYLATDQQMDTLKMFVLAPSSRCCPLIKHSDADRVTLDLHEQCYKKKPPRDPNLYKQPNDLNKQQDQATKCNTISCQNVDQNLSPGYSSAHNFENHNQYNHIPPAHESNNPKSRPGAAISGNSLDLLAPSDNSPTNLIKQNVSNQVFHPNQAQNLIQEPAKAMPLMTQYKCIECAACGLMLTPKRFVGHVHWPNKEMSSCHWGFNSYNWRQYIRLCKKQTKSNLSDHYLVQQFKMLKRVKDEDQSLCDDWSEYKFDKIDYAEQLRELTERLQDEYCAPKSTSLKERSNSIDDRDAELANYRPSRELVEAIISACTCSLLENYNSTMTNTVHTSYTSSSLHLLGTSNHNDTQPVDNTAFAGSSSSSSSMTVTTNYKFDDRNPTDILPVSSSTDNYKSSSGGGLSLDTASTLIYNHSSLGFWNALHGDYNNFHQLPPDYALRLPPTVPHSELSALERLWHRLDLQRPRGMAESHLKPSPDARQLKQESYISSCMNNYLKVTGINRILANNILGYVLDIVRTSKFIT